MSISIERSKAREEARATRWQRDIEERRPQYEERRTAVIEALGSRCNYCGLAEGTITGQRVVGDSVWTRHSVPTFARLCIRPTAMGELLWPYPKGTYLMRKLAEALEAGEELGAIELVCRGCLHKGLPKVSREQ